MPCDARCRLQVSFRLNRVSGATALKFSYPHLIVLAAAFAAAGCIPKTTTTTESSARGAGAGDPVRNLPTIEDGPWMDATLPPRERVTALLAVMTRDEKLTLLMGYYGADAGWKKYVPPAQARLGSAGFVPGIARLGVPPQWQTDAGIGVATQGSAQNKRERTALPSGLAVAASWDPAIAEAGGRMIGEEAHASGFNVMLAGSVNLLRDSYCGRNFEYAGEDPYLAGTIVGAQIKGIQSSHVISTMKHFAINDQETDRDKGNSVLDPAAARMSDLLAFELALQNGHPASVMCAYNKVNGTFSCENEWLLTDVLRRDWGFTGYVLSDWGAVHSTAKAANAGLEQASGYPFDDRPYFGAPLREAVDRGEVSAERLDEMAGRVLHSMFEVGLFEHPPETRPIDFEKNAEVTREAAEAGMVLLKNRDQLLPLAGAVKTVAIIGGYADRGVLSGGGSSQVYPRGGNAVPGLQPTSWPGPVVYYPSSPLVELGRLYPKAKLTFDAGKKKKEAAALASKSDVAIVFVTQWTTESLDAPIQLPDDQDDLIRAVAAANPKTVVVLETGGPVLMPWANEVGAILLAWYPGTEGGSAIARVLAGKVNPSGRLPFTVPARREQMAHPNPPKPGKVHYTEGATVGYKWFDQKKHEPLFEFGHGLSYTTFTYEDLSVRLLGKSIEVTFTVENTDTVAGKGVGQVYIARDGWEAPQRLGAYQKVSLEPGEARQIVVHVDPRLLASWKDDANAWVIAAGPCEIRLGSSSRKIHQRVQTQLEPSTLPADSFGKVNE